MAYDFNQNSQVDEVYVDRDHVVLYAPLLFGLDNNETKWKYVPAVKHVHAPGFFSYGLFYKGGSRERPINFATKREAIAFFQKHAHGRY